MIDETIKKEVLDLEPELIELRRWFHIHPELSWNEYNTRKKVEEKLDEAGIPYVEGAKTGVIGIIKGANADGRILGLRADMDALPVTELADVEYKSVNDGVMHACGHDTHTAMLAMAGKILAAHKDELKCEVRLIFQPAEEFIADSGAAHMKDEPLVKECDSIIGLHVFGAMDGGIIYIGDGAIMASADTFDIEIQGKGAHGASPHEGIDPIAAGVEFCNAVNRVLAREIDTQKPAVISVTAFNSGTTSNVVPGTAHLMGTCRALDAGVRDSFEPILNRIAKGVGEETNTTITVDYHYGCPVTINFPKETEIARKAAYRTVGEDRVQIPPRSMGSEDFPKYTSPKAFAYLGVGVADKAKRFPQHNPYFVLDEQYLKDGVGFYVNCALCYSEEG